MRLFTEKLVKSIAKVLTTQLYAKQHGVVSEIQEFTKEYLQGTTTYRALVHGELKAHFGFPVGTEQERVDAIVDVIAESIYSRFSGFKPAGKNMSGTWRLQLRQDVYDKIINLPGSTVENTGFYGGNIDWLQWMLELGDDVTVAGFHIKFGDYSDKAYSRSGEAIMVPSLDWAVPPEYSGTKDDNWITRSFNSPLYQGTIKRLTLSMFK